MSPAIGVALLVGSIVALVLARPRGGEVIAILRSDKAQSTFMMTWIVAVLVGACLVLLGPPPMMGGSFIDSVAVHAPLTPKN
jgi:hypothetical protein